MRVSVLLSFTRGCDVYTYWAKYRQISFNHAGFSALVGTYDVLGFLLVRSRFGLRFRILGFGFRNRHVGERVLEYGVAWNASSPLLVTPILGAAVLVALLTARYGRAADSRLVRLLGVTVTLAGLVDAIQFVRGTVMLRIAAAEIK